MNIDYSIRAKHYSPAVYDKDFIVLHYTANSGLNATALGNARYFERGEREASAHFVVDEGDTAYCCVPDNMVAWAVGGSIYPATKGASFYGKCTNANSISIEMVSHSDSNGYFIPSKTIDHAFELVKMLQKKYGISNDHVIRHYDVNGKPCPWCWTPVQGYTDSEWIAFKGRLEPTIENERTLYRVQVGAFNSKYYADLMMEDIKSKGYSAFVIRVNGLWKVQVGAFLIKTNAYNYLDGLKSKGINGFVTVVQ